MELYNEMRENWERLYWDEGYSKKLAQDHANYDSAEDDDEDFSPYRLVYFLFLHSFIIHSIVISFWEVINCFMNYTFQHFLPSKLCHVIKFNVVRKSDLLSRYAYLNCSVFVLSGEVDVMQTK